MLNLLSAANKHLRTVRTWQSYQNSTTWQNFCCPNIGFHVADTVHRAIMNIKYGIKQAALCRRFVDSLCEILLTSFFVRFSEQDVPTTTSKTSR
jgi:hypothetical protein